MAGDCEPASSSWPWLDRKAGLVMLYLCKNEEKTLTAVHGVDYHNGLGPNDTCGRVHKYHTKHCRPVLYTDKDIGLLGSDRDRFIPYTSLSDEEILALGTPAFFNNIGRTRVVEEAVAPRPKPKGKIRRMLCR